MLTFDNVRKRFGHIVAVDGLSIRVEQGEVLGLLGPNGAGKSTDEDKSDGSRQYIARLEKSGEFAVDRASRAEAENAVRLGQRSAYVVIKPGFGANSQRLFFGETRQIETGIDPARQAEAGMLEGLLTKYAMQDMQRLFSEPDQSRKMIDDALDDLKKNPDTKERAPIERFLGELDTFLGTPMPQTPSGQGPATWEPLRITKTSVARQRQGPENAFEVTFPQGVVWGIIGCVMTFAVSLVSERVRGTFVRLQMAPLTRTQILSGKALACFASIVFVQLMLFTIRHARFAPGIMSGRSQLCALSAQLNLIAESADSWKPIAESPGRRELIAESVLILSWNAPSLYQSCHGRTNRLLSRDEPCRGRRCNQSSALRPA